MYAKIKELADEAIALQNKNRMDAALREISGIAERGAALTMFEDMRIAKWGSEPCPECLKPRARCAPAEEVAAAQPGDTVQGTGISDGAGNEKITSVTVKPAKKGGAK